MGRTSSSSSSQKKERQPKKYKYYQFRKIRLWLAWPFVVCLAIYARSTSLGFLIGAPLVLAGEVLRVWSHGFLRKTRRLATDGPYAHVRNPLYLGNFLIGLGFCVVIWHHIVITLYVIGFFLLYWVTVLGEEERLSMALRDEFNRYKKNVRRFIPSLRPYEGRSRLKFAMHRVWGHGELITMVAILDVFLLMYLRQEFYQLSQSVSPSNAILTCVCVGLSLFLIFILNNRKARGQVKFINRERYKLRRWRNWQTRKI
jgi:protein-S-isoprenylcysteine O-methyltransferase Ste14